MHSCLLHVICKHLLANMGLKEQIISTTCIMYQISDNLAIELFFPKSSNVFYFKACICIILKGTCVCGAYVLQL